MLHYLRCMFCQDNCHRNYDDDDNDDDDDYGSADNVGDNDSEKMFIFSIILITKELYPFVGVSFIVLYGKSNVMA